ncbi:MAG: UDP-N-acetylmuramoyl-tripeptide--D-alanyl-D-alanine ligase [Thermomicrobiales bacterium]|jgi:UDP-N-acetylmuramoyl-tripeptide--D-alanyl-D-alanine ligase|nr:UDP-N-acetylmuramoyl-tripeptide--D-alanyl-D-alanine ligase [Thermomicrobiales bacterium]
MPTVPLQEVLTATGARLYGELPAETAFGKIERNSKQVLPGDLFIAVKGERFDGHIFVEDAATHGAAAALVRADWAEAQKDAVSLPLLAVDEPVAALQGIARARCRQLGVTVVGITGSIGKTSTKEVVAAVLGQRFTTYRSPGNMNSEIGLPLSLLEIEPGTEVAVLEMGGAYAFGELALLATIAPPKIGLVTNVHPVHLERMGTIEAIAQTKSELVEAVPPDGVAVLNGDDHRVLAMAPLSRGRVLTYGLEAHNDVRADQVETHGLDGTSFRLCLDGEMLHVKVPLIGSHAVQLALAGFAVGHALGMHISEMLPGFDDPAIQVRLLVLPGPNGSQLIDDTYNASTPSVLSALGLLAELQPERRIAVLGDMRELGAVSEEEHRIVGRRAAEVIDLLVTYGELARTIAEEAQGAAALNVDGRRLDVTSFGLDQREALVTYLLAELREGDTVLLKGSRGLEMEDFVAALRAAVGNSDVGAGDG